MWQPADNQTGSGRLRLGIALAVGAGTLLLAMAFLQGRGAPRPSREEPLRVGTAVASRKTVPVEMTGTGSVEAANAVAVRSRVAGELTRIHFRSGQEVKKGDPLFTLDPGPLEAALAQAETARDRDFASERQAEALIAREKEELLASQADADRVWGLYEQGLVPRNLAERYRKDARSLAAAVHEDQAAVAVARANARAGQAAVAEARERLDASVIRAPIGGTTGRLTVSMGARVRANEGPALVTLTQQAPVYVAFSVPEQEIARVNAESSTASATVLTPAGDALHPASGHLTSVEPSVDRSTGTVRVKALFKNNDHRLWPGQQAQVTLVLSPRRDATVVPSKAVQTGRDGPYVYVVNGDMTVQPRSVKTGLTVQQLTVVETGLQPGERVVTDGHRRLFPGAHVVDPKHG